MTNWSDSIPVHSTETGRVKRATSEKKPAVQLNDGFVRLRREVKGRGGGTVIVINGIQVSAPQLKELATALKKKCGCGGTAKDGVIEIQGDHRDVLAVELQARGFKVKMAGG
jgi:translation initiation factor 1